MLSSATHQSVGDFIVGDGKFEFIAVQSIGAFPSRTKASLYYLAFVGLENDAFLLKIVKLTGIDAVTIDEEEAEIEKQCECQNKYKTYDGDDFCFAC